MKTAESHGIDLHIPSPPTPDFKYGVQLRCPLERCVIFQFNCDCKADRNELMMKLENAIAEVYTIALMSGWGAGFCSGPTCRNLLPVIVFSSFQCGASCTYCYM